MKWNNHIDKIIEHKELLKTFSKILLVGETGTGKTTAIDTLIKKHKLVRFNFDSKIIDFKMGQSSLNVMSFFSKAYLNDCIVMDEVDSYASKRDPNTTGAIQEYEKVTNAILTSIDNMKDSSCLFAMTNMLDKLDKAFVRRFDLIIHFENKFNNDYLKKYFKNMLKKYDVDVLSIDWEDKKPYEIEHQIKEIYINNFGIKKG